MSRCPFVPCPLTPNPDRECPPYTHRTRDLSSVTLDVLLDQTKGPPPFTRGGKSVKWKGQWVLRLIPCRQGVLQTVEPTSVMKQRSGRESSTSHFYDPLHNRGLTRAHPTPQGPCRSRPALRLLRRSLPVDTRPKLVSGLDGTPSYLPHHLDPTGFLLSCGPGPLDDVGSPSPRDAAAPEGRGRRAGPTYYPSDLGGGPSALRSLTNPAISASQRYPCETSTRTGHGSWPLI